MYRILRTVAGIATRGTSISSRRLEISRSLRYMHSQWLDTEEDDAPNLKYTRKGISPRHIPDLPDDMSLEVTASQTMPSTFSKKDRGMRVREHVASQTQLPPKQANLRVSKASAVASRDSNESWKSPSSPRPARGDQRANPETGKAQPQGKKSAPRAQDYMKYEPEGECVYGLHPVLSLLKKWAQVCGASGDESSSRTAARTSVHRLFVLESALKEAEETKANQSKESQSAEPLNYFEFVRRTARLRGQATNRALARVLELARSLPRFPQDPSSKIEIVSATRHVLDRLSGNRPHNGVVIDAAPIQVPVIEQLRPHELWPATAANASQEEGAPVTPAAPVWLLLDGVLDPQNVGAILRTAAFFGCTGVIVCGTGSAPLSPVVAKASSGAMETMTIMCCRNPVDFLVRTRQLIEEPELPSGVWSDTLGQGDRSPSGVVDQTRYTLPSFTVDDKLAFTPSPSQVWQGPLRIVALSPESPNAVPITALNLPPVTVTSGDPTIEAISSQPVHFPATLLVVGSEGRGLSPAVGRLCHLHATILPSFQGTRSTAATLALLDSLNVSNAVAIALNQLLGTTCRVQDQDLVSQTADK